MTVFEKIQTEIDTLALSSGDIKTLEAKIAERKERLLAMSVGEAENEA